MKNNIIKIVVVALSLLLFCGILFVMVIDTRDMLGQSIHREGFDTLLSGKDICSLAQTQNTIYAGGAEGVYEIDKATLSVKNIGDYRYTFALLADGDTLWVGHYDGLTKLSPEETITFTKADGLPDNRVNALLLDKSGRLWAGTWGGAIVFEHGKPAKILTVSDGLLTDMVNSIFEDSFGGLWFGSYVAPRGGVSVLAKGKWQYFTPDDALLHANINAILERRDGSIIVGGGLYTKGGGTRFVHAPDGWLAAEQYTKSGGLAGEKIRSLFEDSSGRLWVGSEYDGLAVLSGSGVIHLDKTNGLSDNEVKVVREDESGTMWVGTKQGLTRITKGGLRNG